MSAAAGPEGGFGLYVHWPFCAAKCPYCDFNSHVRPQADAAAFAAALCADLVAQAARLDVRPPVHSVFFGGGTPSLMPGEAVARVLETVAREFALAPAAEITLEANPTSADAGRFRAYARAGVNRVSLGVQALDDASLKALGRWHGAAEALVAVALAREVFPRVSFDLIYARPGQTQAAWHAELARALALGPTHLSLYQLTIEEGTPFAALHAAGALVVPGEEAAAALYEQTVAQCAAAGLAAYEVSNVAVPGEESRHNLLYWRYGEYLGIGPGAHGRVTWGGCKRATVAERHPERWRDRVAVAGHGLVTETPVEQAEQARELLVMGLRLREGLDPARYARLAGAPLAPAALAQLEDLGLIETGPQRIAATSKGRLVLNAVIAALADGA